jgi:putative FmdB family regulatory protein
VIGNMPTYDYLCQTCSHRFEVWQKMTDEPLTECPECGSHIRRVLYPAGVVFKGSGFYKTDHGNTGSVANDTSANGKKAESTEGSANSATGEGKAGENKASSEKSTTTTNSSSGSSEGKSTVSTATK